MGFSRKHSQPSNTSDQGSGIALGSLTHVGMRRAGNEDSYFALTRPNSPGGIDMLAAVADGMGGHQAGEVASSMATRELLARLSRIDGARATPAEVPVRDSRLTDLVREVNSEVCRAASGPETRRMGTTLTVAALVGSTLSLAHVGDSRAYLLREGRLHQLTQDHSWVAEEVARGALTPQEAQHHPRRNVLTRALGLAPNVLVDGGKVEVRAGDTLLLCSDGLHGLVDDGEIARLMAGEEPQDACRILVDRANELGGHDNITVVVARVDGIRNGTGPVDIQPGLRQMTTLDLHASPSLMRRVARVVRVLLFPLWLPVWLPVRLLKLLLRKRS